tara:strand:- start:2237 stop:3286 length:1050 start_codon:yes stop_codon:yes gene_type:complete
MSDPIKFASTLPTGAVLKSDTAAGVASGDYGPTSETGWYSGLRTSGYTITIAQDGAPPLIYAPGSNDAVIQFCNTTASPGPSSTITTIDEALEFISTSDYMIFHGTDSISDFPAGLVMDGLSCYVDAQIAESVDTSGEWKDVSGNGLCFYSYGTGLSLTSLGGYTGFQFNDSGYFQANDLYGSVDMGGDCTLVMWVWCTSIASRDTIFEKAGDGTNSYRQEIAVTWETSEAFSYYSRRYPNYDHANTAACNTNSGEGAWNMMAIKMSTGRTATARTGFYSKNGANWVANYNSRSDTALDSAKEIRIGYGYAGPVEGTNGIGALLTYNKMLSDTEIGEVYDAMKSKFGLS